MRTTTPEVFRDVKEYREKSSALELAQATFNEEGIYRALDNFAAQWYESNGRRAASVLDLCAASGLAAARVARRIPVASIDLVDIDPVALDSATYRLRDVGEVRHHTVDSIQFMTERKFDLVLANSAYHHIEDARKVGFLSRARLALADCGQLLLGEHFLPPYASQDEFREAVEIFYGALIEDLCARGENPDAIRVIRRAGLYCWEGHYEYKVSWSAFLQDLSMSGLAIRKYEVLWAPDRLRKVMAGSVALVLQATGASG